ncbi:hypothetical protein [Levilactobacillus fujinensis]|uniref:XRE family transcriptional regulator n=1 Tax=Levilactobacillus fujinensis TaxID=2486024 RepID=A0ABW1TH90_9LACO|nr:hypothetical protein [Levilactobacillus fujinensis]
MQKYRHPLGETLRQMRLILAPGAMPDEILAMVDLPTWYLLELERGHITRPNPDTLTLIYDCYQMTADQVANFRMAVNLKAAITKIITAKEATGQTYQRQSKLQWPSSDLYATEHPVVKMEDPAARNSYADILRCVRKRIEWCPLLITSFYYRISPMAYWQMEAAQLPATNTVIQILCQRLNVTNLDRFIYAEDLYTTLCRHLNLSQQDIPAQLRLPMGNDIH